MHIRAARRGGDQAGARAPRHWLILAAALVCIAAAVGVIAVTRLTGHGDPDPGGRILDGLRSSEVAVPNDATAVSRQENEAHWDSCDGRAGTFGWSPISVIVTFRSATEPGVLITQADDRMVAAGWVRGSSLNSPIGPGRTWTRTVADGTNATSQLVTGTTDNGQSITWELSAYAPARGPHASGC
jgi:hypothetical protein